MQISQNHSVQDLKIRNNSVVLGSIKKHDLENQLSSTRGKKGHLSKHFQECQGWRRISLLLVKYFFHPQSVSSHVKRIIILNISSPTGKTLVQMEIDLKLRH